MADFAAKSLGALLESTKRLFEGQARSVMIDEDKLLNVRRGIAWQFVNDNGHRREGRELIMICVMKVSCDS
jgi:hypothetical protein